ncbi:MAG: hypothetical protein KDC57_15625, partial [Saprospiraceae bacterium]|nr:hypothetical protein [Saprospiraceae bacterium]
MTRMLWWLLIPLLWAQCHTTQPLPQKIKLLTWTEIDSLEAIGKYQSASNACRNLFESLEQDDVINRTKALIYLAKYQVYLDADGQQVAIRWLDQQTRLQTNPVRAILHSFAGEQIAAFADQNRWGREDILPGIDLDTSDLQTWPLGALYDWATSHYLGSVASESSTNIPLTDLGDLILWDSTAQKFAPSLHYLLLDRAVQYLQRPEALPVSEESSLTMLDAVSPLKQFLTWEIGPTVFAGKVLHQYQKLLEYVGKDQNPLLLVQTDLKRLEYALSILVNADKEGQYERTIDEMLADAGNDEVRAQIILAKAKFYARTKTYLSKAEHARWNREAIQLAFRIGRDYSQTSAASGAAALIADLQSVQCNIQTPAVWIPGTPAMVRVDYRNLSQLDLRLYPLSNPDEWQLLRREEQMKWLEDRKPLLQWYQPIADPGDYLAHTTEIPVQAMELGLYILAVKAQPEGKEWVYAGMIQVSDLVYERNQGLPTVYHLYRRSNGEPVAGATGKLYKRNYDRQSKRSLRSLVGTLTTNDLGEASTNNEDFQEVHWSYGRDTLILNDGNGYAPYRGFTGQLRSVILTDRAIYRPGQRIQLKAIIYRDVTNDRSLSIDHPVEIRLLDANQQLVESIQLRTNAFGSATTSFLIPNDRLAGSWSIQTSDIQGYQNIQVESYKRPTFDLVWLPDSSRHILGDDISVRGTVRNLSGNFVQGAQGKYKVYRQLPWFDFWRIPSYAQRQLVASGTFQVDDAGLFTINYHAEADPYSRGRIHPTFQVEVEVTDLNGETHQFETSQQLSDVPLVITMDKEQQLVDEPRAEFSWFVENYDHQPQQEDGIYRLYSLDSQQRFVRSRRWQVPDLPVLNRQEFIRLFPMDAYGNEDQWQAWPHGAMVEEGHWTSAANGRANLAFPGLEVGAYVLEILTTRGDTARSFLLNLSTTRPLPVPNILLIHQPKEFLQPGDTSRVYLASSWPGQPVWLSVEHGENSEQQFLRVDGWQVLEIPIRRGDLGNVVFQATAGHADRVITEMRVLEVPWLAKQLQVSDVQFDSVVEPGAALDWSIKVKDQNGQAVQAEVGAVLYDASLDQLLPHQWDLPGMPRRWSMSDPRSWRGDEMLWLATVYFPVMTSQPALDDPWFYLNTFNYPHFGGRVLRAQAMHKVADSQQEESAPASEMDASGQRNPPPPPNPEPSLSAEGAESVPVKARKNFEETAFFFPQLQSGRDGEVRFSFTMPDAFTRWKWMIVAHTKEFAAVVHTETLESRRELMIFPNIPRFVRSGDLIEWPVKVVNTSDQKLDATTEIHFFTAYGQEPLKGWVKEDVKYQNIQAHASALISWMVQVPDDFTGLIGCTLKVTSDNLADQEERLIPVLTNKTLITDAYPFYLNPGESKTLTVSSLPEILGDPDNSLIGYQLDWTADPAWLVLPALTYIQQQDHVTASGWVEAWYSWLLGAHLVSTPVIRKEIERWPVETLKSPLEDNQEVKAVALRETPWVGAAQEETRQMQQIKSFLDANKVAYEIEHTLGQLLTLQQGDGGFSWCPQGQPDTWITLYVLEILGQAHQSLQWIPEEPDWVVRALAYLDDR